MSDQFDNHGTIARRPLPKRPPTGLAAWIATLGYMSSQHSPDALLKLIIYSGADDAIHWAASVAWGQHLEQVWDKPSLAGAFRDLWLEVDHHHVIFKSAEEALKQPINYADEDWLDVPTQDILHRLIWITRSVFKTDWQLIIVYQPTNNPQMRVQARLIAQDASAQVGGRGPSVVDACHDLYRNAARIYVSGINKPPE